MVTAAKTRTRTDTPVVLALFFWGEGGGLIDGRRCATRIGAIRANWLGQIDSQKRKPIFITFERFARIASNLRFAILQGPETQFAKKGFRNPSGDSHESGRLSFGPFATIFGVFACFRTFGLSVSWKAFFRFFRKGFASQMGQLRGLHPYHIGTLDFKLLCAAMDFVAEFLGGRFLVAFTVLTAEKHTPKIRGKMRWKDSVKTFRFSVRFSVHFSVRFFGAFFGEQLLASKSWKFVQNPFCKRDPLAVSGNSWPSIFAIWNIHGKKAVQCEQGGALVFLDELQRHTSQTYPTGPDPLRTPPFANISLHMISSTWLAHEIPLARSEFGCSLVERGCSFLAYNWKLSAYNWASLLTIVLRALLLTIGALFCVTAGAFLLAIVAFLLPVGMWLCLST